MNDTAIFIENLGKMYKLYRNPADKVLDTFGINHWLFWRKNYYQEFWALRGLNLEVKKGERLGIIGRNGAGKSTLLKIITGNVSPTEGMVEVKGRIQALMELGTGFHPEFTGRENIRASLAYQGLSKNDIDGKEEEIIDFSELEDFIDQPIKTYSAGMYARLAFSTATSIQPEILIIDEVLGAGDAYFAGKCLERMKKLTEESGSTVLFVSHDLGSVQALCDRIIWVDRGLIRFDDSSLSTIKQYSAMIRQQEEIRLKARDLKISKKQALLLNSSEDSYERILFHLTTQGNKYPNGKHKIRSLSLKCGTDIIGTIKLGYPMDNSCQQMHYILDSPGLMDWGLAQKDKKGYFRNYEDCHSKYAHAPFEFSLPKSYLVSNQQLYLEIEADCENDEVVTEIFIPKQNIYLPLGNLSYEQKTYVFQFNSDILNSKKLDLEIPYFDNQLIIKAKVDNYGSQEALITKVKLLDHQGKETKNLLSLESFQVILEYQSKVNLKDATFVFCIYLPSGVCASQWVASNQLLNHQFIDNESEGEIIFSGKSLYLGKGSYVASAAIFKHFDSNGLEPEAYHLLDRCIHFQVYNRTETDQTDYGICRQPIDVKVKVYA